MEGCLERLQQLLREAGLQFEVLDHRPVATTQEAAAAEGVAGRDFAKAVMVLVDGAPQLCVVPAPATVDLEALRRPLGATSARVAREGEFERLFPDCTEGALPPIPFDRSLPVYLDRRLLEPIRLTFEAGDGVHSVRMNTRDYVALVRPRELNFAAMPERRRGPRLRPRPLSPRTAVRRAATGAGLVSALVLGRAVATRVLPGSASRAFAMGVTAGAVAAALADPRGGARRRALVRDKTRRYARLGARWTNRKSRYWRGRLRGARHGLGELRPAPPEEGGPRAA